MDVKLEALQPPVLPRIEVIDEFYNAIVHRNPVLHSGAWARATTAVSLAILTSSQSGQIQMPLHQIAPDY
jgi:phthalate 4,5-cis-dihydrodiol dehydrogenase